MTMAGWEDLPLEVKLRVLSLLPAAGEGCPSWEEDEGDLMSALCGSPRRPCAEGVCREWRDLLWQERAHLDLSLRATVRDVSNEEGSLRRVLSRCKRLATLVLSHCPVSDDVLSAFEPFGPTLRVLILTSWYDAAPHVSPQLSNDGLLRLAAIGAVERLERLALGGCVRVTGLGVADFAAHCPQLRDLDVSGVWGFGDVHVKAVVESARHLTRINLGGTAISDVGLRHLFESECAARLEYVGLAGCSYLTSSSPQGGIVDLGARCPGLTELDLSYLTQLNDKTLCVILERCLKLEAINLVKCESIISSRTVARMKQSTALRTVYLSRYQALYSFMKRHSFAVLVD